MNEIFGFGGSSWGRQRLAEGASPTKGDVEGRIKKADMFLSGIRFSGDRLSPVAVWFSLEEASYTSPPRPKISSLDVELMG